MKCGIIGGGPSGLALALELARAGQSVELFERSNELGGLAGSFALGKGRIERYYHYVCGMDRTLVRALPALGLEGALRWRPAPTGYFAGGRLFGFGSIPDILRFTPLPFASRVRFPLGVLKVLGKSYWERLDEVTVADWMARDFDSEIHRVIWSGLMEMKFGAMAGEVSAAWLWGRIYRAGTSRGWLPRTVFGAFEHGSQMVIDSWARALTGRVRMRMETGVERIAIDAGRVVGLVVGGALESFDAVISTLAIPSFLRIDCALPEDYRARLASIPYRHVVCAVIALDRPVSHYFWINTIDPRVPFEGIVNYLALNPRPDLGLGAVLYLPHYCGSDDPAYTRPKDQVLDEYLNGIEVVLPGFRREWVQEAHLFRAPAAQAVTRLGFARSMPHPRTPLRGLYIADSVQFYPFDRSISECIDNAARIARLVQGLDGGDPPGYRGPAPGQ